MPSQKIKQLFVFYLMNQSRVPSYEKIQESEPEIMSDLGVKQQEDEELDHEKVCWNDLFLNPQLLEGIKKLRYFYPSHIQAKALPYALDGKDLLCQARSGSGKTGIYAFSILNQISLIKEEYKSCLCLIIVPTRELAHQINKIFRQLSQFLKPKVRVGCYFGGIDINFSRAELSNSETSPHIIVGTPGRLLHLTKEKLIKFQNCRFFVLDECDIMIGNPSMKQNIKTIFDKLPFEKQVFLTSATIPNQLKKELTDMLREYVEVCGVNNQKIELSGLKQFYIKTSEAQKLPKLIHLIDSIPFHQVIIFVNRIDRAQKLTELLKAKLFNPICIHSAMSQEDRLRSYDAFKSSESKLLVATDLFGRGIDVEKVNFVINYDFPLTIEAYLHRVGRAGRFGGKGLIINFINAFSDFEYENKVLIDVQKHLEVKIECMPAELNVQDFL